MAPYAETIVGVPMSGVADAPGPDIHFCRRIESELPFLRRIVRRWHRNSADADDLVQETILRALTNAHLWQPDSNLRGWLFTIMRNEFLAAAAKSKRAKTARGLLATGGSATTSATSIPDSRLAMRDVERALHWLPDCQQTALRLAVLEGESTRRQRVRMKISVAAFRCHLSRARKRLKTIVEGHDMVLGRSSAPRVREDPPPLSLWPTGDAETYRAAVKRPRALLPA